MQFPVVLSLLASSLSLVAGQQADPKCASVKTYCPGGSLMSNYVVRCENDTASSAGSCSAETDAYPGFGYCYESAPGANDASCIKDCSWVTAANGSSFYPLGCTTKNLPRGAPYTAASNSTGTGTSNSTGGGSNTPSAPLPIYSNGANLGTVAPSVVFPLLVVAAGMVLAA